MGSKRSREFLVYGLETDRIRYVHEPGGLRLVEKVNVFYESLINDKWVCIVRYDNFHGYLHRHLRISLNSRSTVVDTNGVIKKGNPSKWLTWAIQDLKKNCLNHKKGFLRRNKIKGY